MKDIAHRMNAYIKSHTPDLGDSNCETVLDADFTNSGKTVDKNR